ncbi:MAG: TolC family protein, partial [Planctomycetota bacterium]
AERNVVYAARNFARFRKQFFVDFASSYYRLILSFRQIEIESQNYFSLVRAFNQAEAEFGAGSVPRVQVDQVEQNLLNARGSLIGTCNGVEQSLDSLKISMGIPTETPLNLDLRELNELTRLDQLSVSSNLTNRVRRRLETATRRPDRATLASGAATLIERMMEAASLAQAGDKANTSALQRLLARFLLDETRILSETDLDNLQQEKESVNPSAPTIYQRSVAHAKSQILVITRQLELAELNREPKELLNFAERQLLISKQIDELGSRFANLFAEGKKNQRPSEELPVLIEDSDRIRQDLSSLIADIDQQLGIQVEPNPQKDLDRILGEVRKLLGSVTESLDTPQYGLKPIEIDPDDAMITALVLRFDLTNQREQAVDDWRQIKLAADNLKSILDLSARQVIRTDPTTNQPFNFSFEDSTTQLGVRFDAPLNRFAQRNTFRATLISYQRALRNLMQLEDSIKFSVRNDLRNLALDREQYLIAVASAALAYERVVSTSLAFRLGSGGVSARDFLEAQTAYINALSSVASRHINYILDRTQLFLDLELLTVDETGFWQDLRNEEVTPEPTYGLPDWAFPVFGKIPCVMYSREMRYLMEQQPICSGIYQPADSGSDGGTGFESGSDLRVVDPPAPSIIEPNSDPKIRAAEEITPLPETMEAPESTSLPLTPANPM